MPKPLPKNTARRPNLYFLSRVESSVESSVDLFVIIPLAWHHLTRRLAILAFSSIFQHTPRSRMRFQ
ncbi:hypothetical protein V502_09108 [Pseudogymnoascus sp. VKM F-4520 (FW-2644)]|nr:hypothetical protein V502_09108 [Pseudogymnoascus sp. VKM F-4520 (FW-2644)]